MPKMIQLRHVPDDLHRKLKASAAIEGMSLSDYILREVRQFADKPTMSEMKERLARREARKHEDFPGTEILRAIAGRP
jgi:antitoxin FitA